MGTGASHEKGSRPRPATGSGSRPKRLLVNATRSTQSADGSLYAAVPSASPSPVGVAKRGASSTGNAALVKPNQRKPRVADLGDEDLAALTRDADPTTLQVLQLIEAAEGVPSDQPAAKLSLLRQCYPLLEQVPNGRFDQLATAVYHKEGAIYQQQRELNSAKETYARAITLAENRVARGEKDLYAVLKRYVLAMIGTARIWFEQERDAKGFTFVDPRHPKVSAAVQDAEAASAFANSMSSLESSLCSAGSVFSINQAILKALAPRPPRRRTQPRFARVPLKAPNVLRNSQFTREDDFVLHSAMTRELIASPCELLLLRCCEVVEIGLSCQSELLIPPLLELAQLYEDLGIYSRALLLVRRCLGILCSVYDYDHPWVIHLSARARQLQEALEEQTRDEMATKIQATWKMHRAMEALADALGRPVRRHVWLPRKYRPSPELNFLGDFMDALPPGTEHDGGARPDAPISPSVERAPEDEGQLVLRQTPIPRDSRSPPSGQALYAATRDDASPNTFTVALPHARVVGNTQDSVTDTYVQPTQYGDMLTVRTTTVHKTITEETSDNTNDDEEDDDEEDEEDEEEEDEEDDDESEDEEVAVDVEVDVMPPPPPLPQPRSRQRAGTALPRESPHAAVPNAGLYPPPVGRPQPPLPSTSATPADDMLTVSQGTESIPSKATSVSLASRSPYPVGAISTRSPMENVVGRRSDPRDVPFFPPVPTTNANGNNMSTAQERSAITLPAVRRHQTTMTSPLTGQPMYTETTQRPDNTAVRLTRNYTITTIVKKKTYLEGSGSSSDSSSSSSSTNYDDELDDLENDVSPESTSFSSSSKRHHRKRSGYTRTYHYDQHNDDVGDPSEEHRRKSADKPRRKPNHHHHHSNEQINDEL